MIAQEPDSRELAFLTELELHVNKWVAITNYGSDEEAIVAVGDTISDVQLQAESKGFEDVTFFKVPPTDKLFAPPVPTHD